MLDFASHCKARKSLGSSCSGGRIGNAVEVTNRAYSIETRKTVDGQQGQQLLHRFLLRQLGLLAVLFLLPLSKSKCLFNFL